MLGDLLSGVLLEATLADGASRGSRGSGGRGSGRGSIKVTSESIETATGLADSGALGLEEVGRGRVTRDTTKDNTAQEGRTTKTVGSVDTTSDFTSGEETGDGLAIGTDDAGLGVDLKTTHGVVEDGLHDGDVEEVIERPLSLEELLAEGVLLGADADVVIVEGLLEDGRGNTELLGESLAVLEALHETTADVVLAVPFDLLGGLAVEDETDGILQGTLKP